MRIAAMFTVVACMLAAAAVSAATQTFSGRLDDLANTALVASNLGAPSFANSSAVANNVALYSIFVPVAGAVSVQSFGYARGGIDPYFTLFRGTGNSASFVASNYGQAFATGGDFIWSGLLPAGNYRLALGVFANLSFAENLGSGTLADGFIALGDARFLGNSSYELRATTPVPEPPAAVLLTAGLLALIAPTLLSARQRWCV